MIHRAKSVVLIFRQFLIVLAQYYAIKRFPSPRFSMKWRDRWLCLRDATLTTGFDRHYVFHTSWAARIISETMPHEHVDISSSLYFVGLVSAFVPVKFIDFRPADLGLSGLKSEAGNLLDLPFYDNSIKSLSCMHVVEHIGLGRYGDELDYDGDIKAAVELARVLAPNGNLMFVVPVGGVARIQFNAHRIYTYDQVLALFPSLHLKEFALIPDDGSPAGLIRYADSNVVNEQRYGCGCFHFTK